MGFSKAIPSYRNGYAPRDGVGYYPSLKPYIGWVPSLGIVGRLLKDIIGRYDASFKSTVRPNFAISGIPQRDNLRVLEWTADTTDSFLDAGDVTALRFKKAENWHLVMSGMIDTAGDERTLAAKWTSGSGGRQMLFRATNENPAKVNLFLNGTSLVLTNAVIVRGDWFTVSLSCLGTGANNDIGIRVYDKTGKILHALTATHPGDKLDLTGGLEFFGRTGSDEWRGIGGPIYLYTHKLSDNDVGLIARDNLAPIRLKDYRVGRVPAVGVLPSNLNRIERTILRGTNRGIGRGVAA